MSLILKMLFLCWWSSSHKIQIKYLRMIWWSLKRNWLTWSTCVWDGNLNNSRHFSTIIHKFIKNRSHKDYMKYSRKQSSKVYRRRISRKSQSNREITQSTSNSLLIGSHSKKKHHPKKICWKLAISRKQRYKSNKGATYHSK